MKLQKINHIGIAVENLKESIEVYKVLTGKNPDHCEEIKTEQVQTAFFQVGEVSLELLEATSDSSPIAKFIKKQGRGGVHHISVEVDELEKTLMQLKQSGIRLIDETPRQGAHGKKVAFIHPQSMGGVLYELVEA